MIIKDLTKNGEIVLKICQYSSLKWNNPRAPPGARDVHCFTRRIYLHIRHRLTVVMVEPTHSWFIVHPPTPSAIYPDGLHSSVFPRLYIQEAQNKWSPAAQSGFHHPELFVLAESHFCFWDLSLYWTLKSQHTVHLTFSHCHDGTLLHIKLLYTHTRTLTTAWLLVLLHLHGWGTT